MLTVEISHDGMYLCFHLFGLDLFPFLVLVFISRRFISRLSGFFC